MTTRFQHQDGTTSISESSTDKYNEKLLQKLVQNMDPPSPCKPVLVTGADGYVAGVLLKYLLQLGFVVHATYFTKTPQDLHYVLEYQQYPQQIKFFRADLLEPGSFETAMQGCEIVFHTASPFCLLTDNRDADQVLVQPAVRGTENVLRTANTCSKTVRRVVLTSSVGAMYANATETTTTTTTTTAGGLSESSWNFTSTRLHQPYFLSKTLAEQKAWTMAGSQTVWTLVVINPAMVLGPGLVPHTESESYKTILKMTQYHYTMWFGCPDLAMPVVDVREVAVAHIVAALRPATTSGRHIVSAANSSTGQLATLLHHNFPRYPLPASTAWWVPRWLVYLVAPYLRLGVDRKTVWHNMNQTIRLDNSKSKQALGLRYRSVKVTLRDMYQQLVDEGLVQTGPPPEYVGAAIVAVVLAVGVGLFSLCADGHVGWQWWTNAKSTEGLLGVGVLLKGVSRRASSFWSNKAVL